MRDRLIRHRLVVVPRRRHELDDPGQELEPVYHIGSALDLGPVHRFKVAGALAPGQHLVGRQVFVDLAAGLPECPRGFEVGNGLLVACDISRHRQGKEGCARYPGPGLGFAPGGKAVAYGVGGQLDGLENFNDRVFPEPALGLRQAIGQCAQVACHGPVGRALLVFPPLNLAGFDLKRRWRPFFAERFE